MVFDVGQYRHSFGYLDNLAGKITDKNQFEKVSELSAMTHIPVLALLVFLGEKRGFSEAINHRIESVMNFYGITSLKGVNYEK